MTVQIIRGNALDLPLADDSVDLVVTSPPYFGLRSYQDGGEHYAGQIGSEPTPAEFVDALLAATREMVRVLKPSGSLWVNLGDKYDSGTTSTRTNPGTIKDGTGQGYHLHSPRVSLGRPKSLIGIPWRYALRCIDDLGLILRAEVIWSKPNGLPESVTDRVRRSHEQWFHFTLQPRYFSAVDEVREQYEPDSAARRLKYGNADRGGGYATGDRNDADRGGPMGFADAANANPLGKLPGSVWTIPTQPLTVPTHLGVDHFAAFPMEFPRRIIRGWSPAGVCVACGDGRRPVTSSEKVSSRPGIAVKRRGQPLMDNGGNQANEGRAGDYLTTISSYACSCSTLPLRERCGDCFEFGHAAGGCGGMPPTIPATVLDPFGGTGTTALVAHALGRHGISVDMSADYCRLARWRTTDRGQLASALQVDKPAPVIDGQGDLFEVTA